MKRVFNPMLFLMANAPDVEKNLDLLLSMLQATTESIKNIRNGIDGFHSSLLKVAQTAPEPPPAKDQPIQTPEAAVRPDVPSEPSVTLWPIPSVQMPAAKPPVS